MYAIENMNMYHRIEYTQHRGCIKEHEHISQNSVHVAQDVCQGKHEDIA